LREEEEMNISTLEVSQSIKIFWCSLNWKNSKAKIRFVKFWRQYPKKNIFE
jgi:hypothetical protein